MRTGAVRPRSVYLICIPKWFPFQLRINSRHKYIPVLKVSRVKLSSEGWVEVGSEPLKFSFEEASFVAVTKYVVSRNVSYLNVTFETFRARKWMLWKRDWTSLRLERNHRRRDVFNSWKKRKESGDVERTFQPESRRGRNRGNPLLSSTMFQCRLSMF